MIPHSRRQDMKANIFSKKSLTALIVTAVLLFSLAGSGAFASPPPEGAQVPLVPGNFTSIAGTAKSGVVNISTVKTMNGIGPVYRHFFENPFKGKDPFRDFFGMLPRGEQEPSYKERSLGSGFILDREGYIVTNNHVIDRAEEIQVKLADGREFKATVVGRDPNTDLALIRIKGGSDLTPLPLGNSDRLDVGTWVVAIGSPFGLEQTVTAGIVSAKGRVIGAGPYDDFIQTDASINPGNSGGPLLNLEGEVVGINTAIIAGGQGIGFAIPVNLAREVIPQLKAHGTVTRGWLGVAIQDLTQELARYYGMGDRKGVLVTEVFPGEPADKGGLKARDVILSVDGREVSTSRELSRTVASIPAGKEVAVQVLREGKPLSRTVTIAKRPAGETALAGGKEEEQGPLGLTVGEMKPEIARSLGLDEKTKGLVVLSVTPGSTADRAGFQQGDLLLEINRKPLDSMDTLKAELSRIEKGKPVQVLVNRPKSGMIVIPLER
jgi:serine protease Do